MKKIIKYFKNLFVVILKTICLCFAGYITVLLISFIPQITTTYINLNLSIIAKLTVSILVGVMGGTSFIYAILFNADLYKKIGVV